MTLQKFKAEVIKIENIKHKILEYIDQRPPAYFSILDIKDHLSDKNLDFNDETVKKYLYHLRTEKKIYDAGRGWYSTMKEPFRLDTAPLQGIVQSIKTQFPLLPFSVWSTEQIKSYFHHLPAKFITFVYSDNDLL